MNFTDSFICIIDFFWWQNLSTNLKSIVMRLFWRLESHFDICFLFFKALHFFFCMNLNYHNLYFTSVSAPRHENQRLSWSILFYTMMWMLRALWLVVAHDLLEYRYMDDVKGNLFSLFCSTSLGASVIPWEFCEKSKRPI